MSSKVSYNLDNIREILNADKFNVSKSVRFILLGLVIVGIVAFFMILNHGDAKRAWAVFQVNSIYWTVMSAAGTCFTAVFYITNAEWSRPVRRIFESYSNFFLISPLLFVIMYFFGADHVFSWIHEPVGTKGKDFWLSKDFLYLRDLLALSLIIVISRKAVKLTLKRDLLVARSSDEFGSRWNDKCYDAIVGNTKGDLKSELDMISSKMGRLSPAVIIFFAICLSLVAFDQEMSVDPHWFSTLFGAFVFMGGVYIAFSWLAMLIFLTRNSNKIFKKYTLRTTLHDAGKMLFGFGIFWAYLFWSHYLPLWYANMPEETQWLILRARDLPWRNLAWTVLGGCFILPFFLGLNRDLKQVPVFLFCTGLIVAVSMWLQHYILFVPTLYKTSIPLGIEEVFVTLGFAGLFILLSFNFLSKYPLIQVGDIYLKAKK